MFPKHPPQDPQRDAVEVCLQVNRTHVEEEMVLLFMSERKKKRDICLKELDQEYKWLKLASFEELLGFALVIR